MDKKKVKAILIDLESLTNQERVFLTKKLIKWTASDMRMQANAIDRLTNELNNARECADILRMELADFNAKKARGILKQAEQKIKENDGLSVCYLVDNETGEPVEKSDIRGIGEIKNKDSESQSEKIHPLSEFTVTFDFNNGFRCSRNE